MEDIATDDDLLSDMLLDSLEFEPKIATHKMNQAYRSPRYKTQQIIDIVRHRIVIDSDLQGALDALCNVDVIKKHMSNKSPRQRHEFQVHARRYLETYMPDSGVEFALTTRYKRASRLQQPESSKAAQEQHAAATAAAVDAATTAAINAGESGQAASAVARGKMRAENGEMLGTSMADLCVVATKPFKAGDLILMCKGGVKDLTKSEDEALREEAALDRERRKEQQYSGVLGPGRDFSVIRSARKGCSQLLLGPARFVNHDCDPNCEFHRLGQSQMVFRCLRDVGLNEEVTTYYGDNYFEVGNSECMCRTCEVRGNGIFAKAAATVPLTPTDPETTLTSNGTSVGGKATRRHSSRKVRSPPPAALKPEPTTIRIERSNGKVIEKTFTHHVSGREFDEHSTSHIGPRCTCLTCGSLFWAPEAWWLPDECRRCERHFKIYQGDWPICIPTEPKWSAIYRERKAQREQAESDLRRRKLFDTASPSVSGASDTDTPVKLSPLRTTEEDDAPAPASRNNNGKGKRSRLLSTPNGSASRKKKRVIPDDENDFDDDDDDEDEDESMDEVEKSIRSVSKGSRPRQQPQTQLAQQSAKTAASHAALYYSASDDEDLSDLTSVSANEMAMSRSASAASSNSDNRPCGPKMLGKQAKTETLAMFWGAETGNKRVRKPRLNGLESLSDTVKVPHKHRRTASDVSSASYTHFRDRGELVRSPSGPHLPSMVSPSQPSPQHTRLRDAPGQQPIAIKAVEGAEEQSSPSVQEEKLPGRSYQSPLQHSVFDAPAESPPRIPAMFESAPPSSESSASSLLATQGPERTSVKNLAMAWGAGIEDGGRGSRRRAPRDMGTPTAILSSSASSPKQVKEEGSATPPSQLGKAISPARRLSSSNDRTREDGRLSSPHATTTVPAEPTPLTTLTSTTSGAQHGARISEESVTPHLSSLPSRNGAPLQTAFSAPSPPRSDRSISPASSATGSSVNVRNASPLAGPPTVTFAARPGAVPGQPIRRNLRWGSGKVSLSRPLGGSAGSPLAGPATSLAAAAASLSPSASLSSPGGPGASSSMTTTKSVFTTLPPSDGTKSLVLEEQQQLPQALKQEQAAPAPLRFSNGVHTSPASAHALLEAALKQNDDDAERAAIPFKEDESENAQPALPPTSLPSSSPSG